MNCNIRKLDWDSTFFSFNVCRIDSEILNIDDVQAVKLFLNEGDFKLAYYSSTKKLDLGMFSDLQVKLVDFKTTFIKKINRCLDSHPSIISYNHKVPSQKILDIALQTGIYSRFNVDENIGKGKYEEMYKTWIERSINREIANEVLVYEVDGEVAGYLTVGEDQARANLGIGAVDSKFRRQGIGIKLFESAEKWSGDNGYDIIQAITQGSNMAACRMYEKLGYSIESEKYFYHIWNEA